MDYFIFVVNEKYKFLFKVFWWKLFHLKLSRYVTTTDCVIIQTHTHV